VTVKTQPTGQTCTITNGSGTASSNVTNVNVTCVTAAYTISGLVGGLGTGLNVVLQNTVNSESKTIGANGSFSFTNKVSYNGSYAVTVTTHPTNQFCMITGGSGTNVIGDISTIIIACTYLPGQTPPNFTDNLDGTITDNNTGLMWMKCSQGQGWLQAQNDCQGKGSSTDNYGADLKRLQFCPSNNSACDNGAILTSGALFDECNNLTFAGKTNWRVPTIQELESIIDKSISPFINNLFLDTVASYYWRSTTCAPSTTGAWYVFFSDGVVGGSVKTGNYYVRCVSGP
ncbi:MAG: DUF1566 domain-containing protein, partial [Leptospiraceae bacterium]|nr:DUF1566 domain-containing protein [Leptospiraceae bacterium]